MPEEELDDGNVKCEDGGDDAPIAGEDEDGDGDESDREERVAGCVMFLSLTYV